MIRVAFDVPVPAEKIFDERLFVDDGSIVPVALFDSFRREKSDDGAERRSR